MLVKNVKQTDVDVISFHPRVQKYILDSGQFFPFGLDGKTALFRKTERLESYLQDAPFLVKLFMGKEVLSW